MRNHSSKWKDKQGTDIYVDYTDRELKEARKQTKNVKANPCHVVIKELTKMNIANLAE